MNLKLFEGHPTGLRVLFFTEMWERLSYYGMRGILVLFMVDQMRGGMGMDTENAAAIYGLYTALVYLLALPGGWVADHILGQQRAVFLGGCVIAAGHFSMAIPGDITFYLGLILIVLGTGLLKPNVSTIVGELYPEGGARRDAGFSIFYMGINVGALAGPLICGYLGEEINWHLGFSAAGIGMVLGLIQYRYGLRHLGDAGLLKDVTTEEQRRAIRGFIYGVGTLVGIGVLLAVLHNLDIFRLTLTGVAHSTTVIIVAIAVLYFLYIIFVHGMAQKQLNSLEIKRVIVIFFLFVGAALFWSGFEQAGSSMNLFAERLTNRVLMGMEVPASWFQSVNPLFIILLAPVFGSLWVSLDRMNKEPSIPVKFGLGLLQLGVAFLVLAWASTYASETSPVSPMWLVVTYFLQTTGELCLSPVGLSSVTKLSPRHLTGQMMGIWFMGSALGNLIAGLLAGQFEKLPLPELFGAVALITAGSGLLFLLFSRLIQKMIGDIK
ncbi:MAG: peptide MFS transporter [Calditrichaeota bacterium]|nr:MAG: peptide MFS transporter [Calditrichota bacterium]